MSAAGRAPGRPPRFLPAREHRHRRNRSDAEPLAELGDGVGVHLQNRGTRPACRGGDLRQLRRDHAAGAAPRRPEVHDDRADRSCRIAASNVAASGVSIGSPGGVMRRVALAAAGRRAASRDERDAVSLPAGRARGDHAFGVELSSAMRQPLPIDATCVINATSCARWISGFASRSIFARAARPSRSRSSADEMRRSSAAASSAMLARRHEQARVRRRR